MENEQELLTADDIFNSDDIGDGIRRVPTKYWGRRGQPGVLGMRPMSAADVIKYRADMKRNGGVGREEAFVTNIAKCVCDAEGNLLFTTKEHIERLKQKSAAALLELQEPFNEINGFSRPTKNWDTLREILETAGVEPSVIASVQAKWETPEQVEKNG